MRRTIANLSSRLVHAHFVCMWFCLACFSDVWASVDICQDPADYSRLSIAYNSHDDSMLDNGLGVVGQQNNNFDLIVKSANDKLLFGAGYRYTILDVYPLQPETNGHLHTFFLPLHKLTDNNSDSFRFSIAPAVSASSNFFKNRDVYSTDALQLLAAFVWGKRLSDRTSLRYGICGDHRFGEFQIYPLVSVHWQPHPDWTIQLGFPASQLNYQISKRSTSIIRIAPDGNEWHVLDKDYAHNSQLVYESFVLEWAFEWELRDSFTITASAGRQIDNQFELTLIDQTRVRLSGDSVTRVGASLEWRF